MPGPSPTPRATSSSATGAAAAPYGVANPGRVPADGSQPRLDRAAGGANSADPAAPENVDAIAAAGWTSMLPGPEVGIKIFVAGLIALVIAISGLVTVALRRRDPS